MLWLGVRRRCCEAGADAESFAGTMGEQGSHNTVSKGLLFPDGEVQEQVSLVLPRAVWKSAARFLAL